MEIKVSQLVTQMDLLLMLRPEANGGLMVMVKVQKNGMDLKKQQDLQTVKKISTNKLVVRDLVLVTTTFVILNQQTTQWVSQLQPNNLNINIEDIERGGHLLLTLLILLIAAVANHRSLQDHKEEERSQRERRRRHEKG